MPTLVEVKQKNDLLKKTAFAEAAAPWRSYNATLCHFYSKGNIELIIAFLYQCRKWLIHFLLFIYGETTMQISRFNCVVILALGFICSTVNADFTVQDCQVSPPTPVQAIKDFDISSAVNALRKIRDECDRAYMSSDRSSESYSAAYKPYIDEIEKQMKIIWNRRREQYAQSRVTVTRIAEAVAVPPRDYGKFKGLDLRLWGGAGTVRIERPYPGLKPVGKGCYSVISQINPSGKGDFYVRFEKIEKDGFSFYMCVTTPQKANHYFICKFQADFAYDDAELNSLANRDAAVLKDRIMQAL